MSYLRTYSNARGSVTVLDYKHTFWGNVAVNMAHVRGDPELWFSEDVEIVQMEERADGSWIAWYYSADPELLAIRDELVRLGGWV